MQLIHLAPQATQCVLPPSSENQGILVGLSAHHHQLLAQACQPHALGARTQLLESLGAESDETPQKWFQALDWLEQVPADFLSRLTAWARQQRARQLAAQWSLTYLPNEELRLGVPPGAPRWVTSDHDAGGEVLLPVLATAWKPDLCKFWLDRPAFFSADPRHVPQARLLRELDSLCAQELIRLRGLDLDSAVLETLAGCDLVAEIGWLQKPDWPASRVLPQAPGASAVISLAASSGVQLITLQSSQMWRRPGFLSRAFFYLVEMGLSVDLLATSQTSVTMTLDPGQVMTGEQQMLLESKLECQVECLRDCASIHFLGNKIRQMLPQLGAAFELFDEHPIHLVSQASSDVSLSLVVHENQAERLLIPLHALLFGGGQESEVFGPTYQQLESGALQRRVAAAHSWWMDERERLLRLAQEGPAYVYHLPSVEVRAREVLRLSAVDNSLYALKANPQPEILQKLVDLGLGLECVSPGELERAACAGQKRLFTPNYVTPNEYELAFGQGCWVTLDNVEALRLWPEAFRGREVLLRLDIGTGSGHHKHVRTAGDSSKFGISSDQWPELKRLLKEHQVSVLGLHSHAGSGITDAEHWVRTAQFLYRSAEENFPEARVLNLGGGLGIPDRPGKQRLDFDRLHQSLEAFLALHPGRQLWLEPGRYLVAEAGVLLARVTQIKQKGEKRYLGLETGMNSLIRPALYGAYHPIVNLSRLQEAPTWKVDVVGPICESGDVLGHDRWMPATEVGDVLLIDNAGAYGASMASRYNLREPARELCLT